MQRGFDLFNTGDIDTLFAEIFDPDVDYRGEPQIGALSGTPNDPHGSASVRDAWDAFFAMFDEVTPSAVELAHDGPGRVSGEANMVARAGPARCRSTPSSTSRGSSPTAAGGSCRQARPGRGAAGPERLGARHPRQAHSLEPGSTFRR